jgi:hypothetical protein
MSNAAIISRMSELLSRFVYPAVLRRIRRAWAERYPRPLDPRATAAV